MGTDDKKDLSSDLQATDAGLAAKLHPRPRQIVTSDDDIAPELPTAEVHLDLIAPPKAPEPKIEGAAEVGDDATSEAANAASIEARIEAPTSAPPPPPPPSPQELELIELEREAEQASAAHDRAAEAGALQKIIALAGSIGLPDRAFQAQLRLVRLDATPLRVRELIRSGSTAGAFAPLVTAYDEVSGRLDAAAQVELALSVAEIEAEQLGDISAATKRLGDVHELMPGATALLKRWFALLERSGQFQALAEALYIETRRVAEETTAREYAQRCAELRETKLSDPSGAADALLAYLDRVRDDEPLEAEAARLLEIAERHRDLARFFETRLYRFEGAERSAVRRRIAALHADRLGDPDGAERMLRMGLSEDPHDQEAFELIIAVLEKHERWPELIEILANQVQTTNELDGRRALRRRLAEIAEKHLDRADVALQHLAEGLTEDPGDLETLTEVERLRRASEDWLGLADTLRLRARALRDPIERADVLVELGRVRRDELMDPNGALQALRDAIQLAPKHKLALDELAALKERIGDHTGAASVLRQLLDLDLDKIEQGKAHTRLGHILKAYLSLPDEAALQYQLALDADPNCLGALAHLRRHKEEHDQFDQALELCVREAQLVTDERQRAPLWSKAAELARHRVGDKERALECYEKALEADPEDLPVEAALGEMYLARGDPDIAYRHLIRAANGLKRSDAARATALFVAAGEAAEQIERADDARGAYEIAIELDPRGQKPLARLSSQMETREEWSRTYELCALLILHHETLLAPQDRAQIYTRMARAKRAMADRPAAIRLAKKAQSLAPQSVEALTVLADALAEHGDVQDAAEALKNLARMEEDRGRTHLIRAAKLLAGPNGDVAKAIEVANTALALDARDVEVALMLAAFKERQKDGPGAAQVLATTARLLEGRLRADLLVRAARYYGPSGQDRREAKRLLLDATRVAPTHKEGFRELAIMLEYDGDLMDLAELHERAALAYQNDPNTAKDAAASISASTSASKDGVREAAAMRCFEEAKRLYRRRLGRPQDALRMVRAQRRVQPDDLPLREQAARILDETAAAHEQLRPRLNAEAIEVWTDIVELKPGLVEGLRRLYALRSEMGHKRAARITAEILTVLGEATEAERRLFELQGDEPQTPNRTRPPELQLIHPGEDTKLRPLFERLGYMPLIAFEDALPQPRARKRDRVEIADLRPPLSDAIRDACVVLGQTVPALYARDDHLLVAAPTFVEGKPGLAISPQIALSVPSSTLRFLVGQAVSYLRPRALALALVPLDVLREGIEGLVREKLTPDNALSDLRKAKKRAKALEKLIPEALTDVSVRAIEWLEDPERRSLGDELDALRRTAERMGLMACGSLLVAAEALRNQTPFERSWLMPLVRYCATREYAAFQK